MRRPSSISPVSSTTCSVDPTLKQRLDTLRTDRNRARDALERLREQIREPVAIEPERVAVFASEMRARLREGEVPFRKAYIRAVIDRMEVQPDEIRITGRRDVLERAVTNGPDAAPGVRSSVRECRTPHKPRLKYQQNQTLSM